MPWKLLCPVPVAVDERPAHVRILIPPAPDDQWTLSVQHTDDEVQHYRAERLRAHFYRQRRAERRVDPAAH